MSLRNVMISHSIDAMSMSWDLLNLTTRFDISGQPWVVYVPMLPVYTLDNKFAGLAQITMTGLEMFPLTGQYYTSIDGYEYVLSDYKILVDEKSLPYAENITYTLQDYTLADGSKPVIALPIGVNRNCVRVILYNLANKRFLALDLDKQEDLDEFIDALPTIANAAPANGNDVIATVWLKDEPFLLDNILGTADEREVWGLSMGKPLTSQSVIEIDEPSSEYRLICPQFKVNEIQVSAKTGTTKMNVYNLPSYNRLVVMSDADTKTVHFFNTCSGTVEIKNIVSLNSQLRRDELTLISDSINLIDLCIESFYSLDAKIPASSKLLLRNIDVVKLELNGGNEVNFTNVKCLESSKFANVTDIVLESMIDIDKCEFRDIKTLWLTYAAVNNTRFENCAKISCDTTSFTTSVEFRNVDTLQLVLCNLHTGCATYFMNDNSMLELGSCGNYKPTGVLDIELSSNRLNLSTGALYDYDSLMRSYIEPVVCSGGVQSSSPCSLRVTRVENPHEALNIRYAAYVSADIVLRLNLRCDMDGHTDSAFWVLLLVALLSDLCFEASSGQKLSLSLDLYLIGDLRVTLAKFERNPVVDTSGLNLRTEPSTIEVASLRGRVKEACSSFLLPIKDAGLEVVDRVIAMLEHAGITSVTIPSLIKLTEGTTSERF